MTTVLCVPQWQGSAASGAPRLMAGARRTAGLVAAEAVVTVPVRETAGEKVAGIRAFDALVENQRLTRRALAGIDDRIITVGGDCAVDIAPIAAARAAITEHAPSGDDVNNDEAELIRRLGAALAR